MGKKDKEGMNAWRTKEKKKERDRVKKQRAEFQDEKF